MKLRQICLERERPKLGLKAVMRGKQTRVSVEEIRRTLWKKGRISQDCMFSFACLHEAMRFFPFVTHGAFFFVCFSFIIPSGKIKYAHVYMKKWI